MGAVEILGCFLIKKQRNVDKHFESDPHSMLCNNLFIIRAKWHQANKTLWWRLVKSYKEDNEIALIKFERSKN